MINPPGMSAPSADDKKKNQEDARAKVAAWLEQAKKGSSGGDEAKKAEEEKKKQQASAAKSQAPLQGKGRKRAAPPARRRRHRRDDDYSDSESDYDAPQKGGAAGPDLPEGEEDGPSGSEGGDDEESAPVPAGRGHRGRSSRGASRSHPYAQRRAPAQRPAPRARVPLSEVVRAEVQRHHQELKEAEERARLAAQGERSSSALGALQFFAR